MRIEKVINFSYIIGTLVLFTVGIATYLSYQTFLKQNDLVSHTNQIIHTSEKVAFFLKDAETNHKEYLVTEDKTYLTRYLASADSTKVYIEKLRQATTNNASQQARILKFDQKINNHLTLLAELIKSKKSRDNTSQILLTNVFSQESKNFINTLQSDIAAIEDKEKSLLNKQTATLGESITVTKATLVLLVLATLAIATICFFFIKSLVRKQAEYESNLHKLNQELSQYNEELNTNNEELSTTNEELAASNEQLNANNQLLQVYADEINELYNHAPCGYHSTNEIGLFLNINDTELNWLGYTREEVVGKMHLSDIISPTSWAVFKETYLQLIHNGYIDNLESEMIRKDGSRFPILVNINYVKDTNGKFLKSHATVFDITESKRLQQKLVESEYHYKLIANNVTDLISRHYPDGTYFYVSPSSTKLLGYTPEELKGRSLYDLIHIEDLETVIQSYISLPEIPEVHTIVYRIRKKDKRCIWFETINRYFKHPQTGEITEVLSVSRDVTERKAVEEKLRIANLELKHIKEDLEYRVQERTTELHHALQELKLRNHELDNYVYKVSHDLRAPLASILGLVSLTKLDNDISTIKHYIALIENRVNKSDEFIKSVLNHSRILNAELNLSFIDFEKLINSCIDELRYMPEVDQMDFIIEVQNKKIAYINDEQRLSIIFKNFVSNAIKYRKARAEKSFVKFTVAISTQDALIKIEDNGVGIDTAYLNKIFDMFFRGPIRSEGSGLGLYIVKQTLDRLGGDIIVESKINKGTTFTMTIPNFEQQTRSMDTPVENQSA